MSNSVGNDILSRVIETLAATQKIEVEKIRPESTFEELGIDSLDGINILFALENEFNINIPDESARVVKDIRQLAEGVEKLIEQKKAAEGTPAA